MIDHTTFDRWQAAGGSRLGERLHARTAELAAEPRDFELDPAAWDVIESVLSRVAESRES